MLRAEQVLDEEYSYIPVGGPMPRGDQAVTAFGAAANLVHPATGYSITRMLTESAPLADAVAAALARGRPLGESAAEVWEALWPLEKRRQVRRFKLDDALCSTSHGFTPAGCTP